MSKIFIQIKEHLPEVRKYSIREVMTNFGLYQMHGGTTHNDDFLFSTSRGVLYINGRGGDVVVMPANIPFYEANSHKYHFTKSSKEITITLSN